MLRAPGAARALALHTLNRAVAVAEWRGPAEGLAVLDGLDPSSWLAGSHLWAAVPTCGRRTDVLPHLLRSRGHAVEVANTNSRASSSDHATQCPGAAGDRREVAGDHRSRGRDYPGPVRIDHAGRVAEHRGLRFQRVQGESLPPS